MPARAARPLFLAALFLAAILIGAGSATANVTGAVPGTPGSAVSLLLQTVLLLLAVLGAAVVALFVYALWPLDPRPGRPARPFGVVRPLLIVCVAVLIAVLLVRSGVRPFGGQLVSPLGSTPPRPPGQAAAAGSTGTLDWWLPALIVAVLTAAAAGTAWYLLRPGRRRRRPGAEAASAGAGELVEESLDVLLRERDPRQAVIRAYAAMEVSFGRQGFPRQPFEAPLEYLARVLGQLRTQPDRVAALTALFELARFSHHPIGEAHRTEAIDLLREIRDELTVLEQASRTA
ncbi:MAG: DUF4129 domain-containing protein [Candidatus Dormibacteraeota bacterium]|nr:DUF4129 domain-containing protein [Candidatus Dormibacteraeota bacterium]MBO0762156.1 DUF4129 domain-containing protein [Candidatus Dormibacteraeota bacterium]